MSGLHPCLWIRGLFLSLLMPRAYTYFEHRHARSGFAKACQRCGRDDLEERGVNLKRGLVQGGLDALPHSIELPSEFGVADVGAVDPDPLVRSDHVR